MGYQNPWFNDAYLLRFCRARKFDLVKVIELWQNFMKDRNEKDIENIIPSFEAEMDQSFKDCISKFYPRGFFGVDKAGRPIFVDYYGKMKVPELLEKVPLEMMFRYFYYAFETCLKIKFPACSDVFDRQIIQSFNIMDMNGFGLHLWNNKTIEIAKKSIS